MSTQFRTMTPQFKKRTPRHQPEKQPIRRINHFAVVYVTVVLAFVFGSSSVTANFLRVSYSIPLIDSDFDGAGSPTVFGVATEFSMAFTLDSDDQFLIPGQVVAGVVGIDIYAFPKEAMSDIVVNFGTLSVSSDDLLETVCARQGGIDVTAEIAFDEPLAIGASPELFLRFEPPGVGTLILGGKSGIFGGGEGTTTGLGLGLYMFDATTGGSIDLDAGGIVTVVPEPSVAALTVLGLLMLMASRESRRVQKHLPHQQAR